MSIPSFYSILLSHAALSCSTCPPCPENRPPIFKIENANLAFQNLFQQSKDCFWCEAHFDNGTQSMAHILHGSTQEPHIIIHNQIAAKQLDLSPLATARH